MLTFDSIVFANTTNKTERSTTDDKHLLVMMLALALSRITASRMTMMHFLPLNTSRGTGLTTSIHNTDLDLLLPLFSRFAQVCESPSRCCTTATKTKATATHKTNNENHNHRYQPDNNNNSSNINTIAMDKYLVKRKRVVEDEEDEDERHNNDEHNEEVSTEPKTKNLKLSNEAADTKQTDNKSDKGKEKAQDNDNDEQEEDNTEEKSNDKTVGSSGSSTGGGSDIKQIESFDELELALDASWRKLLHSEFQKPYFAKLKTFLKKEVKAHGEQNIFPPKQDIFNAFNHCTLDKVKVVILGQDPYQTAGFAHGLAFSVKPGVTVPKSLINMYKELESDISGFKRPTHGTLTKWADQGVLMLNTVLTVRNGVANSHQKQGWEQFTEAAIKLLNQNKSGVVYILWGKPAQTKAKLIDQKKNLVLESAHPSPLSASRGFFGCKHFSKCNKYLKEKGQAEIDWQV